MKFILGYSFVALFVVASARPAAAQSSDAWKISVYPILAWVPVGISIDTNLPPVDGGAGGSGPDFGGKIAEGRFDGAYFGGVTVEKNKLRIDVDGLWAAVGGDRVDRPTLTVDVDAIYGHASGGFMLSPGLYVTGGVRRLALKYDINLAGREFERKPGLWDPLVGVGFHRAVAKTLDLHASFEGGGFGVGSDVDISLAGRLDWKPTTHFGIVGGYSLLYFKLSNTVANRTFTAKQTIQGPTLGIGLYF